MNTNLEAADDTCTHRKVMCGQVLEGEGKGIRCLTLGIMWDIAK